MEEKHSEKHGGLFLGVLVGVAVTLLVATRKGRSMLHNLSDEGLTKLGDWEKLLKDVADALEDEDFVDGDDYVREEHAKPQSRVMSESSVKRPETPYSHSHVSERVPDSSQQFQQPPLVNGEPIMHSSQSEQQYETPAPAQHSAHVSRPRATSRRFFRGIPRR